jgi:hypothetical protein
MVGVTRDLAAEEKHATLLRSRVALIFESSSGRCAPSGFRHGRANTAPREGGRTNRRLWVPGTRCCTLVAWSCVASRSTGDRCACGWSGRARTWWWCTACRARGAGGPLSWRSWPSGAGFISWSCPGWGACVRVRWRRGSGVCSTPSGSGGWTFSRIPWVGSSRRSSRRRSRTACAGSYSWRRPAFPADEACSVERCR